MEEGRESWQSGGQKKTRMNNLHLAQVGGMEGSPLVYFGKRRRHADSTRFILPSQRNPFHVQPYNDSTADGRLQRIPHMSFAFKHV